MIETPLSRPESWLLPAITEYKTTWLAVGLCCVQVVRYCRATSGKSHVPQGSPTVRAMAAYWPVFVWGLQAVVGFRSVFGYDVAANISVAGQVAWTMQGWSAMIAAFLVLVTVLSVSAVLQYFARGLVPARRVPIAVPMPVLAAIASVFLFQLGYLLLFLSVLTERPS